MIEFSQTDGYRFCMSCKELSEYGLVLRFDGESQASQIMFETFICKDCMVQAMGHLEEEY